MAIISVFQIRASISNPSAPFEYWSWTRIAKVVNQLYAIIDSLPADERLTKRQLELVFGAVGTLMGLFNTWELHKIAAGVGENRKKINGVIDIVKLNIKHMENLQITTNKLSNIISAMLQNNPAQLNSEIEQTLDNAHDAVTRITNMVQQAQNRRLSVDLLTPETLKEPTKMRIANFFEGTGLPAIR